VPIAPKILRRPQAGALKEAFLPYARHAIDDDDVAAVAAALRGESLTGGPLVSRYEAAFAAAVGAAHAVVCSSGTAALHLAMLGLDLASGDAVVVPAITFVATANAARLAGAEVIFADVDSETGLLTPAGLEAAIRGAVAARPRAAVPVHLNGQLCDLDGLAAVARRHGIALVEDACHALGETNVGACRHAVAACFSSHPAKAIATGEGGAVTAADAALAARLRRLRSHGVSRDAAAFLNLDLADDGGETPPWYHEMAEIGLNYRLPDALCALGLSQLGKLPRFHARRVDLAARYDRALAPLAPLVRPVPDGGRPHGRHLYAVLVDFAAAGVTRSRLMTALRERGIGSQVHFIPVCDQPYYRDRCGRTRLPGAAAYYARCLSLPLFASMRDEDVDRVAAALRAILGG
jgi:UDP-4-amino-4,6-dideoxy-N-acetyl-beta-L-altrosamine transaminase